MQTLFASVQGNDSAKKWEWVCCVVVTDAVLQAKLRHMALAFLIYFIFLCEYFYFLGRQL